MRNFLDLDPSPLDDLLFPFESLLLLAPSSVSLQAPPYLDADFRMVPTNLTLSSDSVSESSNSFIFRLGSGSLDSFSVSVSVSSVFSLFRTLLFSDNLLSLSRRHCSLVQFGI